MVYDRCLLKYNTPAIEWIDCTKVLVLSRVRRLIYDGYWIDNWIYWITHNYTQLQCIHFTLAVYYSTCRVSLQLQLTLTTESLQGPGPPADPTGSHWPSTNCSGPFSATHRQLTRNWNCPRNRPDCRLTSELYSPRTDHKENNVSDSSTVVRRHYRNGPQRKQQFLPLSDRRGSTASSSSFAVIPHSLNVGMGISPYRC
jgi:hypothetical protein